VRVVGHSCDEEGKSEESIQEGVVVSERSVANLDLKNVVWLYWRAEK